jgi:hypothetical protein
MIKNMKIEQGKDSTGKKTRAPERALRIPKFNENK